jgi:hypothetical protein
MRGIPVVVAENAAKIRATKEEQAEKRREKAKAEKVKVAAAKTAKIKADVNREIARENWKQHITANYDPEIDTNGLDSILWSSGRGEPPKEFWPDNVPSTRSKPVDGEPLTLGKRSKPETVLDQAHKKPPKIATKRKRIVVSKTKRPDVG